MGSTCGGEVKKGKKTRKRTKPEHLGKTEVKRERVKCEEVDLLTVAPFWDSWPTAPISRLSNSSGHRFLYAYLDFLEQCIIQG
jgi:hypothetical protein